MRSRAREVLLTVGALVGLLCVLVALASLVLGLRPLVFRSGSMAPAIGTGSLALSQVVPADDLRVGDVVTVPTGSGELVTHRIVQVTHGAGTATLQLRGDANDAPDARLYPVTEAGRVVVSVPGVGYVVGWLTSPVGMLLLGLYAAFLASVLLGGRDGRHDDTPSSRGGRRRATVAVRGRHATRVLAMTVVGGAALLPASASAAPWTDTVGVSGTTLTGHVVATPDSTTCTVSSPNATIAWPEKSSLYDYEVVLRRADNSVVSTRQVTGAAVSTAYAATGDFGFSGLALGTYDFHVEIRSYLAGTTTWRGAGVLLASKQIRISVVLVVVPVLGSISCV